MVACTMVVHAKSSTLQTYNADTKETRSIIKLMICKQTIDGTRYAVQIGSSYEGLLVSKRSLSIIQDWQLRPRIADLEQLARLLLYNLLKVPAVDRAREKTGPEKCIHITKGDTPMSTLISTFQARRPEVRRYPKPGMEMECPTNQNQECIYCF